MTYPIAQTFHTEKFDDFYCLIMGYDRRKLRLTIFKRKGAKRSVIAYQAESTGVGSLEKLKRQIGEYRYALTENPYDDLSQEKLKQLFTTSK